MFDTIYVGNAVESYDDAPSFDGYSRVVIAVSDDLEYTAGDDTGRTLTLDCPWGTQEMAENLLRRLHGFQYQPYKANGAHLDPAAEIGDGVTVGNVYSGVYTQDVKFGPNFKSNISAPHEEEIDHEYPFIPQRERVVSRAISNMSSTLAIQADEISARVTKTGGDASSFGWRLDERSWTLSSGYKTVLEANENGIVVSGEIRATSGTIGGFQILPDRLSYNGQTWGGTNTNGIYIGPNGIQLGRNFMVDSAGNLTAASGTFTGYVRAGSIMSGGDNGYMSGGALSDLSIGGSKISGSSLGTSKFASGVNTSLGYADFANSIFNGIERAAFVKADALWVNNRNIRTSQVVINGTRYNLCMWDQR